MMKLVKINKGVIAFYLIIAIMTMICVVRINNLNVIGNDTTSDISEEYCA